jgi:hypothetical protein
MQKSLLSIVVIDEPVGTVMVSVAKPRLHPA